mmetsp:Transcript_5613/g.17659  ORF Transcript_5613/g.17659 Transcript_5613/m.17659 type:complete len:342 (-) Transcript_5613:229-1254(-)
MAAREGQGRLLRSPPRCDALGCDGATGALRDGRELRARGRRRVVPVEDLCETSKEVIDLPRVLHEELAVNDILQSRSCSFEQPFKPRKGVGPVGGRAQLPGSVHEAVRDDGEASFRPDAASLGRRPSLARHSGGAAKQHALPRVLRPRLHDRQCWLGPSSCQGCSHRPSVCDMPQERRAVEQAGELIASSLLNQACNRSQGLVRLAPSICPCPRRTANALHVEQAAGGHAVGPAPPHPARAALARGGLGRNARDGGRAEDVLARHLHDCQCWPCPRWQDSLEGLANGAGVSLGRVDEAVEDILHARVPRPRDVPHVVQLLLGAGLERAVDLHHPRHVDKPV